jgi:L-fuculose-phosphate aldolase
VAFALARKSPDLSVLPQIQQLCGSVGYADYRLPGSEMLGEVIADEYEKGANVVIMENHGVAVAGASMGEALLRLKAAEFCAQTIMDSYDLGGAQPIQTQEIREMLEDCGEMVVAGVKSPKDYPALVSRVEEAKKELVELVARACGQGLMPAHYGSVSKRVNGNHVVMTPHAMSRPGVSFEDMVWMCEGSVVEIPGQKPVLPSQSWALHEAIYRNHPQIDSIIITQTPALMAHAVAHRRLDVTTNPESWVFVREVGRLPYSLQIERDGGLNQMLGAECPAVLIDNEAIVVTGGALMQTFDRLEVAEFTAKSILLARSMGDAVEMEPEKIKELREAFCL